jgi:glycosyltransferase involved in cell wall biosynthesis
MTGINNISRNAKELKINYFIAENNLKKYDFFNKYFKFYNKQVYVLPFVFQKRFKIKSKFSQRKNKCIALGSYSILDNSEKTKCFSEYFQVDTFHPIRQAIYINTEKITNFIESYISFYNEDVKIKEIISDYGNIKKFLISMYNIVRAKQINYFRFSSAIKLNEYKMFVFPEEINHLPSMGFIEGMACGCAYFGINDDMYKDIGLRPGIHYIAYNNSIEDLCDKIDYYQKNNDKLEKIAHKGHEFVTCNFNGEVVANIFLNDLKSINKYYHKDGEFNCSFIKDK